MYMQWIVPGVIRCNEHARAAFEALHARGMPDTEAENEIARALFGCVWEMYRGHPNRFASTMEDISQNTSVAELFPSLVYGYNGYGINLRPRC